MKTKYDEMMRSLIILTILLGMAPILLLGVGLNDSLPEHVVSNQKCLKCHGQDYYSFYNDWTERMVTKRMNPYQVFDSLDFYHSNHKSFKCIDCHSYEYEDFPHAGELRMEPIYGCMDCHAGDEKHARFNFEGITEAYNESVHAEKHNESFNCWNCHDPHTYKVLLRSENNMRDIVLKSNEMCLKCHASGKNTSLLSEQNSSDIIENHNWLPKQKEHFKSVRCLECHAEPNPDVLVAHKILPKEQAVKKCVECHSVNSLLMATLYKHQAKENRNKAGFFNAVFLGDAYVIGANRNYYLNLISLLIFGITLLGIGVHIVFRILKK